MILAWFQMIKIGKSNTNLFVAFAINFREEGTKLPCQAGQERFPGRQRSVNAFWNFFRIFRAVPLITISI